MLAQSKKMALVVALGMIVGLIQNSDAQQPPSQKYQPVPPAVHVPNQQARQLPAKQFRSSNLVQGQKKQISLAEYQAMQRAVSSNSTRTGYNLSDNGARQLASNTQRPANNYYARQNPVQPKYEPGTIQQTSFVEDVKRPGKAQVPEILRKTEINSRRQYTAPAPATTATATTQPKPMPQTPVQRPVANPIPKQVQFQQPAAPRVSNDFPSRKEMADIQAEISRRKSLTTTAKNTPRQETRQAAIPRQSSPIAQPAGGEVIRGTLMQASESVAMVPDSVTKPAGNSSNGFTLKANPINKDQAIAPAKFDQSSTVGTIQQTSAETVATVAPKTAPLPIRKMDSESLRSNSALTMTAPAIKVEAFGPKSIGVNKTTIYEVNVSNLGNQDADKILVGINIPDWVDVQKVNLSNGTKELTNGVEQARLVWTIDRIPANSSQKITVQAVPRKAEMFDLGVEWTLVPRTAVTSIEVTEPRLEMKISGARDVMYGEKAIYHVTVRNTGTGTAENVTVKLPQALGGAQASLENIGAGSEKNFQVELLARTAGELDLTTTAIGDGDLSISAKRMINVRRAELQLGVNGPAMKYSGGIGQYEISISNKGDATAADVTAAVVLPAGVKYLGGVDSVKEIEGGLTWPIGSLEPGDQRSYKINCELNSEGDVAIEAGARGKGDLVAANQFITKVETIADLVLSVDDPRGPLPTGQNTTYLIRVKNRGSRAAREVNLVMQFSKGIEPSGAEGLSHRIIPGQVLFSPIEKIEPGQELTFKVSAKAISAGTRIFRAQLTCADSDSREIAEGTTRFFGDDFPSSNVKTDDGQETTAEIDQSFQPPANDGGFRR